MSSTKSAIGHLLGAAGAVEAIFSMLAMRDQIAPPTINLDNPSVETADRPGAAQGAKKRKIDVVLSNSFGFGGTNASLVMRRLRRLIPLRASWCSALSPYFPLVCRRDSRQA